MFAQNGFGGDQVANFLCQILLSSCPLSSFTTYHALWITFKNWMVHALYQILLVGFFKPYSR
jgi:hypothetical protein